MAYEINYDDKRFKEVESQKKQALTENENLYGGMINQSDKFYEDQINASKEWAEKQQQIQQENTDFAIEQIEQQKDKTKKDYIKEQSGAYTDWQKQSNKYGANAEQMAANGLVNAGYSESSQVSMYNTYQSRISSARESYMLAVQNYDNAIKDARLQNNSKLAEIAYQALQQQLELSLQGFQYKNQLITEQANKKQELENTYHQRYQDVLNQINTENALAEQVRQYNENLKLQREQLEYQKAQDERNYQLQLAQLAARGSSGGSSSGRKYEVNTAYYQGSYNKDVNTFGTFSNGYQPKGISGHGKLKDSGADYSFTTQTIYGQKQTLTQNVWTAEDGTYWYWEGRNNQYQQLKYNARRGKFSPK